MHFIQILLKQLVNRRMDGLVAALLLVGGLGFTDSASWLQPEQDETTKALFTQPTAKAPDHPDMPKLTYLTVTNGPASDARPFALTKLMLAKSDLKERSVGGGPGTSDGSTVHFQIPRDQGLALGAGATPVGGYGASAPGRSAGAVPEPSEWALIALGLIMSGWVAYRSRRLAVAEG